MQLKGEIARAPLTHSSRGSNHRASKPVVETQRRGASRRGNGGQTGAELPWPPGVWGQLEVVRRTRAGSKPVARKVAEMLDALGGGVAGDGPV